MSRRAPFAAYIPAIGRRQNPVLALGNAREPVECGAGSWAGVVVTTCWRDGAGIERYRVELRRYGGRGAGKMGRGQVLATLAEGRLDGQPDVEASQ